ncbi:putative proteasome endopeptidase complex [Rosa chinensis]|uniref:Putative proteasome endopeptidase complex n=1 Tax=Rosa chinensis TaxID=74649 RepID=A0A2P6PNW7_ROSCH|nr:putative proteasome endopeptidase complex [Rosa chinensis]
MEAVATSIPFEHYKKTIYLLSVRLIWKEQVSHLDLDVSYLLWIVIHSRVWNMVVNRIQSVKGTVVIDVFFVINPLTMKLGQEPWQTTSCRSS